MNGFLDAYYRVSTKSQKDEGYSLESQQTIARNVAKRLKLKLREHNEFAKSSTIRGVKRDKFEEIKSLIEKEEIKNLWIVEQERLFRKPTDAFLFKEYFLDEYGVTLYVGESAEKSHFSSDVDNEMFQFRAIIAGLESKKIRRRSIRGKRHLLDTQSKSKSIFLGGTPTFGYQNIDKEWVVNKEESKWVKWMFRSYADGMSSQEIQSELNINGVPPRRTRNGLWNLGTIQKMLSNESYTGIKRWFDKELGKEWVYQIPQIVPVSVFQKVQSKLEENLKSKDNNKKHHFLLDGILNCSCGLKMGNESKNRGNKKTETYYCVSRNRKWRGEEVGDCENHKGLGKDATDKTIQKLVKSVAKNSVKLREMFKTDVLEKKSETDVQLKSDVKRLETKVKRLQKQIESTVENIAKVEVSILQGDKEELVGRKTVEFLNQERDFIEKEYKKTLIEIEELNSQKEWIDWLDKYGDSIDADNRSDKKRREFIHGLVKKIVVNPAYEKNRDGELVQLGHSFDVYFKMKIVGDKLVWNDDDDKSLGYELVGGRIRKTTPIVEVAVSRGQPKKKLKIQQDNSKDCSNVVRNRGVGENSLFFSKELSEIHLCFVVSTQFNNCLPIHNPTRYSDEQLEVHRLIKSLKDSGLGYRRVAHELNSRGIKTHTGKEWGTAYVYAVLKRHREHMERRELRQKEYPLVYSNMWVE